MPYAISLADANSTYTLGVELGRSLPPKSILLLEGDLGAGKTTLVQGIGAGLGIQESIDSPTFTLINEYRDGRVPLYHCDLYRLEPLEVDGLHLELYWEAIEVEAGIVAIEWSERLRYKPDRYLTIQLQHDGDRRSAQFISLGGWEWDALAALFEEKDNSAIG
jgi:tRNA threonylcarbamoyladenosine biosynthesis protein TsaE